MTDKNAYFDRYFHLVENWEAFQAALQRPLPTTVWTNTLRTTPAKLAASLAADGIQTKPIPWYPGGFCLSDDVRPGRLWQQYAGLYHIQEATSMMPVRLLDPQPGERILDMCAAPGNKTVQMGVAMSDSGTVVAGDISNSRLRVLRMALNRLGLTNTAVYTTDTSNLGSQTGQFDRILVDAPCSCEGTSRRSPHLLTSEPLPLDERRTGTQRALLRKAVQLCKPGGRIVYATCTYAPEENEAVVDAILREAGHDTIHLLPADLDGVEASPGITQWRKHTFDASLRHARRLWPHQNDSGGFFMALIEKLPQADAPTSRGKPLAPETTPIWGKELEQEPWLSMLHERFGIDPARFDDYLLLRWGRRGVFLVRQSMTPPRHLRADNLGIMLLRVTKRPKLTTGAAMLVGQWAAKNVVEVDEEQMVAYLTRETVVLTAVQAANCTDTGFVIVNYQGKTLGIGQYWSPYQGKPHRLESQYPKNWAAAPD